MSKPPPPRRPGRGAKSAGAADVAQQSFTYPAPDGELFAPDQFDSVVGRTSNITRGPDEVYPVEVVGVSVASDGMSVVITLETDAVLTPREEALIGFALRQLAGS